MTLCILLLTLYQLYYTSSKKFLEMEKLSLAEKRPIFSLLTTIITFAAYYWYVTELYIEKTLTVQTEIEFWSAVILILIPVFVVSKIIIMIILTIINTIITGDETRFDKLDEFGKLIDIKATRNFYHVFIVGFLAFLSSLAFSFNVFISFNIILFTILVSAIIADLSEFYYMRSGV